MKKITKAIALISVLAISAGICAGCTQSTSTGTESKSESKVESKTDAESKSEGGDIEDVEAYLADKKVGVQIGTTGAIYVGDYVSADKGGEVKEFNNGADAVLALTQGKIDCVVIDEQPAKVFVSKNEGLKIVDKELTDENYAAVISKSNPELLEQVNQALKELQEDGTLDKIIKSYIPEEGSEGGDYHYAQTVTEGDKLVMATSADFPPYEYREADKFVGIDIEIGYAVADKLGKVLDVTDMKFDSIIPAVDSGKADIGFSGFTVTDERMQQINFTDNYAHSKQVVIIKE